MSKVCQYLCLLQLFITVVTGSISSDVDWLIVHKQSLFTRGSAGFVPTCRPIAGYQYDAQDGTESRCQSARPRALWQNKKLMPRTILSTASQPPESTEIDERATIFVGNLPWALDSYGLRKLFEPYGKIRIAQISWDDRTDRSRSEHSVRRTRNRHLSALFFLLAHHTLLHSLFHPVASHALPTKPAVAGGARPFCSGARPAWRDTVSRGRGSRRAARARVGAGGTGSCRLRTPPPPPPPPPP